MAKLHPLVSRLKPGAELMLPSYLYSVAAKEQGFIVTGYDTIILTDEGANDWRKFLPQRDDIVCAKYAIKSQVNAGDLIIEVVDYFYDMVNSWVDGVPADWLEWRIIERGGIPFPRYNVLGVYND